MLLISSIMLNFIIYIYKFILIESDKCPALSDPDNGKVFIVSDGKVAIFTCSSGFVIIGNSYLQCINGVWSSPPPKCHAP